MATRQRPKPNISLAAVTPPPGPAPSPELVSPRGSLKAIDKGLMLQVQDFKAGLEFVVRKNLDSSAEVVMGLRAHIECDRLSKELQAERATSAGLHLENAALKMQLATLLRELAAAQREEDEQMAEAQEWMAALREENLQFRRMLGVDAPPTSTGDGSGSGSGRAARK